jgi:uncharacterized protein YxeA
MLNLSKTTLTVIIIISMIIIIGGVIIVLKAYKNKENIEVKQERGPHSVIQTNKTKNRIDDPGTYTFNDDYFKGGIRKKKRFIKRKIREKTPKK